MNILALDLATRTGWAMREGGRIESGVQDFSKKRGDSNGMLFLNFNRWLRELSAHVSPADPPNLGLVVWEQAHHRGGAATEIGVGLSTRAMEFCAENGIDHATVHSMTLKKWATGSGKSDKQAMIREANLLAHKVIVDDNEADAVLLLRYAISEILGEKEWNVQPAAAGSIGLSTNVTAGK